MNRRFHLLTAVFSLFIALLPAQAQAPKDSKPAGDQKPKPAASKDQALKAAAVTEPDPEVLQRRTTAVSLLTSLADDARSFKDPALRARVQARAADALWTTEPDRARDLFHRAWDAAEAGDAEAARRATEDAQKQLRQSGTVVRRNRRDMRSEVLQIVAKRDKKLANEFLQKLEDDAAKQAKDAATDADVGKLMNKWSAPEAQAKRIALARSLLQDGDVERAMAFAGPVLDQVNRDSINFLSALREKNAQAADAAFAMLLARASRDPLADANTVAGLSSYAFTPFLYVTFSADGGSFANQEAAPTPPPALSAELRNGFFQVAMGILMKPQPPPDQDTSTSGRSGKYMVIKRLLPLFEQYSPQRAAELRVMMNAIGNEEDVARGQGNRAIDRGIAPDDGDTGDPMKELQNRIDRAKTSEERDGIYADIAVAIAGKGDPKGRDLADKIEDSTFRKQTLAYIDFELVRAALQKKDVAEMIRIAKTGELTRIQRVWTYTQAARLTSDQARAIDFLQEGAAESRRMEGSDSDRARGLVAVANGFAAFDRARAWEFTTEAIKAANGAEGFTGEDGQVMAMLRSKNMAVATAAGSPDFNVADVFGSLASEDFYRSLELAKNFSGDTPRANATIAVARAILEPKQVRPNSTP